MDGTIEASDLKFVIVVSRCAAVVAIDVINQLCIPSLYRIEEALRLRPSAAKNPVSASRKPKE